MYPALLLCCRDWLATPCKALQQEGMGLASLLSEVRMNFVVLYKSGIGAAPHTIQVSESSFRAFAAEQRCTILQGVLQAREALLLACLGGVVTCRPVE